jgi:hypothetical protein
MSGWPFDEYAELAEQGESETVSGLFPARYGGVCRACGGRFEAGDMIAYDRDEDGIICEACAAGQ